jgi:chromate reductase, NAD(P)H dehydrogenase (quinone)
MITIISGTNRHQSLTLKFAHIYKELLEKAGASVQLLALDEIPVEVLMTEVYKHDSKPTAIDRLQHDYFVKADKFVFIFPEYNGSLPGVLKLLIDSLDPRIAFKGKKAALIGISTGRAGNLRGLDHLTSILHHMQVQVLPFLLPVSKVQGEFDDIASFKESTLKVVNDHIKRTLDF